MKIKLFIAIVFFISLKTFSQNKLEEKKPVNSKTCKLKGTISGHEGKGTVTLTELAGFKSVELKSNCGIEADYKIISFEFFHQY